MRRLFAFIALLLLCAAPSAACSVVDGYKVPSNFDLVKESTVIVLAHVKNVPAMGAASSPFEHPGVTLEPIRFLKGSAPADQLRLMGWSAPGNWSGVPTTTTLSQSHWSTGIGACVRQFYSPGELVIAMFRTDTEAKKTWGLDLIQVFEPFARAVETVDDPNDIWVHAVDRYVALQAGPSAALNDRINGTIAELKGASTAEAQAIVADLQYHLTRKESENVWADFSTPMSTIAGVTGHGEVAIYCLAGTPPGILVRGEPPSTASIRIGSSTISGDAIASLSPVERATVEPPLDSLSGPKQAEKATLFHFTDKHFALAILHSATGSAEIVTDGRVRASGLPLDALLRWSAQCTKLQALAAPTEADLARKPE